MTDADDTTAAERLAAWRAFAAVNRPGYDHLADVSYDSAPIGDAELDTVLREHQEMRRQLGGLKVAWGSIYSDGEYDTKAEALNAATADRFGTPPVAEDVTWRLVGEWRQANEEQP